MENKLIEAMLQKYGVAYRHVLSPQKGYRNAAYPVVGPEPFVLIIYKSEPRILTRIKNANRVGDFLASQGLPARRTYNPRIMQLKAGERTKYACLYHYLPGQTIPWEAYTKEHIKNLGGAMGAMHAALQKLPNSDLPSVVDEQLAILARMTRYFADSNVQRAMHTKLKLGMPSHDFERVLRLCARLTNQQILHMDFVRGNILFKDKTITGILDFEKTAVGHPVFDLARTLAFLLVDCKFKEEAKIRKYFLHSGYKKRGHSSVTHKLLETLLDFFLLHDFYKFLRHNPYESLPKNEHFTRTRDLLLKRGAIR